MSTAFRFIIAGDRNVGKSSLILTIKNNKFLKVIPRVIDPCFTEAILNNTHYQIELYDTSHQPEYWKFKPSPIKAEVIFDVHFKYIFTK